MNCAIRCAALAALASAPFFAASAHAEVVSRSETGFAVRHEASVATGSEKIWAAFLEPARWWSSAHTWSGDAKNLSLYAKPGGCWCETWEEGAVSHMTVVAVRPGRSMTLSGGLGPLQAMGVSGAMTFSIEPEGEGATLSLSYAVGGRFDPPAEVLAPAVDGVIGEQFARLIALINDD